MNYKFLREEPARYFHNIYRRMITNSVYKYSLKFLGSNVIINKPLIITKKYLSVGNNVSIGPNCRIEGVASYEGVSFIPQIIFDDFCSIEQNLHLTCAEKISIGKNTAIAANVSITDIHHPYEDINIPIERQKIQVKAVAIGDDCKIYNNSVILPGTNIGKHCTIGANSVVSGDIPDYSVVVGTPGKIIKRYSFELEKWTRTDEKGNFLK
jgi:acetyltransferase-like isoleucine patch superfamily enzyme